MYNMMQARFVREMKKECLEERLKCRGVIPLQARDGTVVAVYGEQNFKLETTLVAINFNDKVLVTNPTTYHLGRGIVCGGIIAIIIGVITHFTGDCLLPAPAWCALGIPTTVIGEIFRRNGLTKNGK
jgi:hypothetical protein